MSEQFKVADLAQETKIYNEFIEIPITSQDKEYAVKLYPFFSPTKIRKLVQEIGEFYQLCEKEKLVIPQDEQDDLVGYFILKEFSNMIFTKSKKAKNIYTEFKMALDSSLFKTLLQAIPKQSIQSVYERIYEVIEASSELESQFKHYQEIIKDLPLENREIIKNLGKKLNQEKQIPEA